MVVVYFFSPCSEALSDSSAEKGIRFLLGVLGQILGSPKQRHGYTRACPAKGHNDDEVHGAFGICGEADRAGTVHPKGRKAQRDLISICINTSGETVKKSE